MILEEFLNDIEKFKIGDLQNLLKLSSEIYKDIFIDKKGNSHLLIKQFILHILKCLKTKPEIPQEFFIKYIDFNEKYKDEIIEILINKNNDLDTFISEIQNHPITKFHFSILFSVGKTGNEKKIEKIANVLNIKPSKLQKYLRPDIIKKDNYPDKEIVEYFKSLLLEKENIADAINETIETTNCGISKLSKLTEIYPHWINRNNHIRISSLNKVAQKLNMNIEVLLKFKRNKPEKITNETSLKNFTSTPDGSMILEKENIVNVIEKIININDEELLLDCYRNLSEKHKSEVLSVAQGLKVLSELQENNKDA
jgi:hypothetical protein